MLFRFALFTPSSSAEDCICERSFEGEQEDAVSELSAILKRGDAVLGQLLRDDGLVLHTAAVSV